MVTAITTVECTSGPTDSCAALDTATEVTANYVRVAIEALGFTTDWVVTNVGSYDTPSERLAAIDAAVRTKIGSLTGAGSVKLTALTVSFDLDGKPVTDEQLADASLYASIDVAVAATFSLGFRFQDHQTHSVRALTGPSKVYAIHGK